MAEFPGGIGVAVDMIVAIVWSLDRVIDHGMGMRIPIQHRHPLPHHG